MFRSGSAHDDFSIEQLTLKAVPRQGHQLFVGPDFDSGFHGSAQSEGTAQDSGGKA